MKTSKFTDEQIAMALRQAEAGTPVGEICRKLGVSEQSFYRWKKRFGASASASYASGASSGTRIASSRGSWRT
jgi:putative transposase